MPTISQPVIWSRPGCQACRLTKRQFQQLGFQPVERTVDEEQGAKFAAAGYRALPVVEWRGETWSGFRPERITA